MSKLRLFVSTLFVVSLLVATVGGGTAGVVSASVDSASLSPTPDTGPAETHSRSEQPAVGGDGPHDGPLFQESTPVANNSSVRHRNPAEVEPENRVADLQRVLERRLSDRLEQSTVEISQGQYEQAQSVLGEEYLDQLSKYGQVADEGDANATTVETFNETRSGQREYAQTVAEFRETHREYREARAEGDEQRARRLGRELVRLGRNASRQSNQLNQNYDRLEEFTGANLSQSSSQIEEVQSSLDRNRTQVQNAEFVETELVVRQADERGSFTDPLTIEATLESADGPVANRQVRVDVGERSYTVETDDAGRFTVSYRPTTVSLNDTSVTMRYVPANLSVYLSSNTSVPVSLERTTGTVEIENATAEAGFGDRVSVTGRVTASGDPVSRVPLRVVVDGTRLGTTQTATNGSFTYEGRLPAAPTVGRRTLTVESAVTGRAVDVRPATESVRIRETASSLSIGATREGDTVQLLGQLTAEGQPVPNQQLAVRASGERVTTVRTGPNGSYRVGIGEDELASTMTVAYSGEGTNLASTTSELSIPGIEEGPADQTVSVEQWVNELVELFTAPPESVGGISSSATRTISLLFSPIGLVVGGVVLGVGGLVLAAIGRWRGRSKPIPDEQPSAPTLEVEPGRSAERTSIDSSELLAAAETDLDAGRTDEAVIRAYGAARNALVDGLAADWAQTHWQFFETCVGVGADADADALRTLTQAYETARYGSGTASVTVAEAALSAARAVIGPRGQETREVDAVGADD